MEKNWDIYSADGTQVKYTAHSLKYSGEFMGDCTVSLDVSSPSPIDWEVNDYLTFRGEKFILATLPKVKKQARALSSGEAFVYSDVTFLSVGNYELGNCLFLDVVYDDNYLHFSHLPKFSVYFANIEEFAKRLQANLNRLYTNEDGSAKWSVKVADGTTIEAQSISFESESCLEALARCNSDFDLNYIVFGRTITIGTKDALVDWEFEYGKHKEKSVDRGGLVDWEKSSSESQAIITRLRAFGNTTNLPYRYYNYLWWRETAGERQYLYKKLDSTYDDASTTEITIDGVTWTRLINPAMYVPNLMLPSFRDGSQTYVTNPGETPAHVVIDAYIDSENISKIGITEGVVYFDGSGTDSVDIYPSLKGMTTQNVASALTATERAENNMEIDSSGIPVYNQGDLNEIYDSNGIDGFDGLIPEEGTTASTFYLYVKNLGFNINDYAATEGAKVAITEGACAGREFDIINVSLYANIDGKWESISKDRKDVAWFYKLECKVTSDTSIERYFPYNLYPISKGDKFVLTGVYMPDVYVRAAEQRLLAEAKTYLAANDHTVYTYTPTIDSIAMAQNDTLATTIKEGCTMHIVNYDSELPIDEQITISKLEITYGEDALPKYSVTLSDEIEAGLAKRVTQEINEKLSNVMNGGSIGGTTLQNKSPYLITTLDQTKATDKNVFSAARAEKQFANKESAYKDFLRKNADDTAAGHINFAAGATVTELMVTTLATILKEYVDEVGSEKFVDGFAGEGWQIWQTDGEAAMTLDKLTVRKAMVIYELLISKIRSVGGQIIVSAANGKIKSVNGNVITLEDGGGAWQVGDYARCQTFSGTDLKSYWARVDAIGTDADGAQTITLNATMLGKAQPAEGDELVLLGNDTNTKRQNAISISATEDGQPRVDVLNGIKGASLAGCLRARMGNLDGISDSYFPTDGQPQGDGLYADNAYLHGNFVLANGSDVQQLFELMDGKLNSVISDSWSANNLAKNGWFLDGTLGWSGGVDGDILPYAGGKALAQGVGAWTIAGIPILQGKTEPPFVIKQTEDGTTYLHMTGADTTNVICTTYLAQPTATGRLRWRFLGHCDTTYALSDTCVVGVNIVGVNADGKTVTDTVNAMIEPEAGWVECVGETVEEFASISQVYLASADGAIDVAEFSLTEVRLSTSQIEQTANKISLSVTESNNKKLKKAGIDIDAESITLSAAHTLIEDADGNPIAAFANGKIRTAFLDLGSLSISEDDIPTIMELQPTVVREAYAGATKTQGYEGVPGTSFALSVNASAHKFAAETANRYIYFSCRATANISQLKVTEEVVKVTYAEIISDELQKYVEVYADNMGNGNYRIKTSGYAISNFSVSYSVKGVISGASATTSYAGQVTATIGGYSGSASFAIVPTDHSTSLNTTMVGANGFTSAWQGSFIYHVQSNTKTYTDAQGNTYEQPAGCTMMAGDYGFRVTENGIQKTSDRGLNWSKI